MKRFKTAPDESLQKLQSFNLNKVTLNNSLITGADFPIPEQSRLYKKNKQLFLEKAPIQLPFSEQMYRKQKHVVYIRKGNSRNRERVATENAVGRTCKAQIDKTLILHARAEWYSDKVKIYSNHEPSHQEFHLLNRPYFMGESITLQRRCVRQKERRIPNIYQSQRMKNEQLNTNKSLSIPISRPLTRSQQSAKANRNDRISPWQDFE